MGGSSAKQMTTSMPTLVYFACRSRGEPIRLACALGGIQFEELSVPEEQHNGRRQLPPPPGDPKPTYAAGDAGKLNNPASFPFGTCPKWVETVDGRDILINQSNAILRHVGRRAELYGSSVAEAALVDAWLDHVEDVRKAYNDVIYGLDEPPFDEALTNDSPRVAAAFEAHKPKVVESFGPFEARLAAVVAGGGTAATPVLVGDKLSVADVALFDIFDVHLRLWADALGADAFPSLHAHRAGVAAQPGIAAYLGADEGASRRRWSRLNGNALG
jgi:glutathione S-transferase